ncbi:hypothetical protein [Piscinibacter sp. XHJ-5]|uniref:hypothetical protein n=1 Tax=Piscinibacter sp. XHJ-5 TaxID=3037797 RepID=UPI0024533A48|nr:hypothetical protein [Piscinibacter sp. XHJ-5]
METAVHPSSGLDAIAHPRVYSLGEASRKHIANLVRIPEYSRDPTEIGLFRVGSMEVVRQQSSAGLRGGLGLKGPNPAHHADLVQDQAAAKRFMDHYGDAAHDVLLDSLQKSGQMAYLEQNADALINDDWSVVIDIDIFYFRPSSRVKMHRDTLGYTMFFNLMFASDQPVRGPEYILNPGESPQRFEQVRHSMPPRFVEHLKAQYDKLPAASAIKMLDLPAWGAVGMVDELIYHSTPYPRHRNDGRFDVFELYRHWKAAAAETYPALADACKANLPYEKEPKILQLSSEINRMLNAAGRQDDDDMVDPEVLTKALHEYPDFAKNLLKRCKGTPDPYDVAALPSVAGHPAVDVPLPQKLKRELSDHLPAKGEKVEVGRPKFLRTWVMAVPRKRA